MPTRLFGLLLLLLLARCGDGAPDRSCDLVMVAEMPLQVQDHLLVVPAGINGQWAHLVVDSGAERTTISDAAANRLNLPHDPQYKTRSLGIGGTTTTTDVTVGRLVLGGVHFPIDRIAVGTFKLQSERGLNADGLLGADILLAFDMDIDVPGGKLTLYRSRTCSGAQPPWPVRPVEILGVRVRKDRLLVPFELDGVAGLGLLDTGAQGNVLGQDMAHRMGLNDATLAHDPVVRQHGVGPGEALSHLHQFQYLKIGPVSDVAPAITVLPSDFGVGDALIGETFLQGRRVWLAFRNRQVFVSMRSGEGRPGEGRPGEGRPVEGRPTEREANEQ